MQFVRLPQAVLAAGAAAATAGQPVYTRRERTRIAARLRAGLAAGRITGHALQAALAGGGDAGIVRLGDRLARQAKRGATRVRLPASLTIDFDPFFATPSRRYALRAWLRGFVERGVVSSHDIATAVAAGDAAVAALVDSAFQQYAATMLRSVAEAVGEPALADSELPWGIRPGCTLRLSEESIPAVVLYPEDGAGFSISLLDAAPATPLLIAVCDALSAVRFSLINVEWPREILDGHGWFGDNLVSDIRSHASELLAPDGSVTYSDDFLEQMSNEYGFDPRESEEDADAVKRLLRFDATYPAPVRGKRVDPVKRLRALAKTPDGAATGSALPMLARWAALTGTDPSDDKVTASPLDEESGTYLSHVVLADLTGFEARFVNDMADQNMQVGGEGAVALAADDPFDALRLATRDICRITVLDRLLRRLGTAR